MKFAPLAVVVLALAMAAPAAAADRRCGSVSGAASALNIRARNMTCGEARALVRAIQNGGARDVRRAGWRQHYRGYSVWWTKGRKRFSYFQAGTD